MITLIQLVLMIIIGDYTNLMSPSDPLYASQPAPDSIAGASNPSSSSTDTNTNASGSSATTVYNNTINITGNAIGKVGDAGLMGVFATGGMAMAKKMPSPAGKAAIL